MRGVQTGGWRETHRREARPFWAKTLEFQHARGSPQTVERRLRASRAWTGAVAEMPAGQRFQAPTGNRRQAKRSLCRRPAKSVRMTRKPPNRGNAERTDTGCTARRNWALIAQNPSGFLSIDRGNPEGPAAREAAPG